MQADATRISSQGGLVVVQRTQDCTTILEQATRLRNEGAHGSAELRHAARIPAIVVERYLAEKGISFAAFLSDPAHGRALLNDPALSGFRVWQGRA